MKKLQILIIVLAAASAVACVASGVSSLPATEGTSPVPTKLSEATDLPILSSTPTSTSTPQPTSTPIPVIKRCWICVTGVGGGDADGTCGMFQPEETVRIKQKDETKTRLVILVGPCEKQQGTEIWDWYPGPVNVSIHAWRGSGETIFDRTYTVSPGAGRYEYDNVLPAEVMSWSFTYQLVEDE